MTSLDFETTWLHDMTEISICVYFDKKPWFEFLEIVEQ